MNAEPVEARDSVSPPRGRKAYRGVAMEGVIARWYSRTQQKSIEQYKSWAKMASGHIPEGGSVLEVAPGPGYLSVEMAKLGNYEVVGLDISRTFVGIATERAREAGVKVDFRQGDVADMPFPDGAFDFFICTAAFKNFPEPVRALDEIFRVMKNGAEGVIIDLDKNASRAKINEFVDEMKLGWINSFMTKFAFRRMLLRWAYTKNQIESLAAESRFRESNLVGEGIGFEVWLRKP
jgi:ubiquinone/menaquinone biosynthesis C-methylase UbiE